MSDALNRTMIPVAERSVEAAVMLLIIGVALVGNISFWIICLRDRVLRNHVSTWLMLCLSAADILVSMINMPTVVVSILTGHSAISHEVCIALGFLVMITFTASVFSLASISLYRYALACHIGRVKILYTNKNTVYIIIGTWLLAVVLSVPPLVGWGEYGYLPGQSICFCLWKTDPSYTYFMIAACFGGPFSVMTYCYVMILRRVRSVKARLLAASRRGSLGAIDISTLSFSNSDSRHQPDAPRSRRAAGAGGRPGGAVDASPTKSDTTLSTLDASSADGGGDDVVGDGSGRDDGSPDADGTTGVPDDKPKVVGAKQIRLSFTGSSPHNGQNDDRKEEARPSADSPTAANTKRSSKVDGQEAKIKKFRAETRLTLSFFVVVLTFVLCWLPFCVTMLISVHWSQTLPRIPDMATLILACLNSCCNPIIYGVMNTKYRPGFIKLFCRKRPSD